MHPNLNTLHYILLQPQAHRQSRLYFTDLIIIYSVYTAELQKILRGQKRDNGMLKQEILQATCYVFSFRKNKKFISFILR